VTDLPEVAIMVGAALHRHIGLATGNLFGGVSMQMAILILLDILETKGKYPLTSRIKVLTPVLEAMLVIVVLGASILFSQMPGFPVFFRLSFPEVLIALLWVWGLWLIGQARATLPWQERRLSQIVQVNEETEQMRVEENEEQRNNMFTVWLIFGISTFATLAAGYCLEESSQALAKHFGINNIVFGATILAFVTALPELTTGLASVKMGEYKLAVSDILGGNAFLPVIFLFGVLTSGKSVFPSVTEADIYIASLGILMTVTYMYGFVSRPSRKIFRMGLDSLAALLLYALGIIGLFFVKQS
jgi:cation:H+ antiporter